jgi:ATP-dependent Clp protease ATP-binding subunit ClpA
MRGSQPNRANTGERSGIQVESVALERRVWQLTVSQPQRFSTERIVVGVAASWDVHHKIKTVKQAGRTAFEPCELKQQQCHWSY